MKRIVKTSHGTLWPAVCPLVLFFLSALSGSARPALDDRAGASSGEHFSLSLTGGLGFLLDSGDYNPLIERYGDFLKTYPYGQGLEERVGNDLGNLRFLPQLEMEFRIPLHQRWQLGLAAGLTTGRTKGSATGEIELDRYLEFNRWSSKDTWDFNPGHRLRIISFELSFIRALPLPGIGRLSMSAGPGYYLGRWTLGYVHGRSSEYYEDQDEPFDPLDDFDRQVSFRGESVHSRTATSRAFGLHAGLGLEVKLLGKASLVVAAKARTAGFSEWKGDYNGTYASRETVWVRGQGTTVYDHGTVSGENSGYVWFCDNREISEDYDICPMSETRPDPKYYTNLRMFKIKLDGVSLQAGIRYTF